MEKGVLIKDKNGNPIKEGDTFKFKYLQNLGDDIELVGSFSWNDFDLRYEIDVFDNDYYTCLYYQSNGVMRDFELIKESEHEEIQNT